MDDGSVAAGSSTSARPRLHRVNGGPRLQAGVDGIRFYTIDCECGWESEKCSSSVLAEAAGEQHLTLTSAGRSRSARRDASRQDR